MLNTFDWFFLPLLNVDGYNHTQQVNQIQRRISLVIRTKTSSLLGRENLLSPLRSLHILSLAKK